MVTSESDSLLVLYDDAQNIYEKKKQRRFSFKSLGIQAQGRTTVLKLNYRNTAEILQFAYEFAKEVLTPTGEQEDDTPLLLQPQSAGRHGPAPEFVRCRSFREEAHYLADRAIQFHTGGIPWNEMAVVYRARWMGDAIQTEFKKTGIPVEWISKDFDSQLYDPNAPSVKLVTMHSSKGLEFPVVLMPGLGFMPTQNLPIEEETRRLYVAMTRAITHLVLTGDRASGFMTRMQRAIAAVASEWAA
jgi:superfamily I DNA/RNA helicase